MNRQRCFYFIFTGNIVDIFQNPETNFLLSRCTMNNFNEFTHCIEVYTNRKIKKQFPLNRDTF